MSQLYEFLANPMVTGLVLGFFAGMMFMMLLLTYLEDRKD